MARSITIKVYEDRRKFFSPVSLQALGDILLSGLYLWSHQRSQCPGITFPFQNGSDDLHAAHATEVAQYIAELHIHLSQDFLHALNHAARFGHQVGPLPPQTTRDPDFVG